MKASNIIVLVACLAVGGQSYLVLQNKAYIQLNDVNGGKTINASTYNRIDFDHFTNILYVLAKEPGRMTAFVLGSDGTPSQLTEWVFNTLETGQPLDIEVCRPVNSGGPPRVAISFEDPSSASADGVVRVYEALTQLVTDMTLIKEIAVGAQPVDIEYGEDCNIMLVANRGRPTQEGNVYRDPEGTVTKIVTPPDFNENSPIISTNINFGGLFTGPGSSEFIELLREENFRFAPLRQPDNTLLSVMQNIEPEHVVLAPNFQAAYVSLPKNNALARLNLDTNQISTVFPLGNRSWTDYYMDASDLDGVANMRSYNIHSLMQPTELKWISKDGRDWLIMLDTGRLDSSPVYGTPDHQRGKTLMQNGDIVSADSQLQAQLLDDDELGRLWVSTEDGKRASDGKLETVFTFGGRGFSIHDANTFKTVSGVVDNIEQVSKQFYRNVFNTAYLSDDSTPAVDVEATSPSLGPNLGSMAVGDYEGKTVMFFGSATSGILYVYQLSPDTDCPQPVFHSVHRAGSSAFSWSQSFGQGNMGDIGITDMMYLKDDNLLPVLVVASATSNSISIYSVGDNVFSPPRQ
ncbi:mesenchyme-specific cell surface glycoprotein-like isoform X2 [Littorina saxatilis]